MQNFINDMATIIFGSVENWQNYTIDNSTIYSEFFTSLIKQLPNIIALSSVLFLLFILIFIFYKLIRLFI